ncbi:MAG TPA: transglycosylase domain-containing protein, partial [Longimicrobiales bacterium]|nr:transglycosylase domain-containing protein [Longimicrobiales bacterium]
MRDHGVALWRRTAHWVRGLPGRAGPWAERLAAWVRRAIRQARPAVRRALLTLRQHRPTPRQAAVLALAVLGISWVLWERCGLRGCPDVEALTSYQPGGASVLLDQAGEPFADLAPMEYEVVPLDSLPDYVPQAFIAVEDRRFREHGGVDWVRVLGAAWADVQAGGLVQGSSTIPMQLSRTLFTDRIRREDKTFRRKLMEARVAREIEDRFTKDEILELYLNHVYLGGGSYGVQAASRYFFGKEAWALTREEAALLAGLPRAPAHYDPRRNPEAARNRRDLVLALMADQGYLEPAAADSARSRELAVTAEPDRDPDGDQLAPYFVQHVRRQLEDVLGETLYLERLRIHTTLDRAAQEAAEAELEAQLRTVEGGAFGRASGSAYAAASGVGEERVGYLQGAVVLMDARGGEVRAWVGGRDYDHSRYDRARLARRQAGSAFKPFVYAAALEAGLSPSQPILDSPYRLAGGGGRVWQPENYSGRFEGRMSMRDA